MQRKLKAKNSNIRFQICYAYTQQIFFLILQVDNRSFKSNLLQFCAVSFTIRVN